MSSFAPVSTFPSVVMTGSVLTGTGAFVCFGLATGATVTGAGATDVTGSFVLADGWEVVAFVEAVEAVADASVDCADGAEALDAPCVASDDAAEVLGAASVDVVEPLEGAAVVAASLSGVLLPAAWPDDAALVPVADDAVALALLVATEAFEALLSVVPHALSPAAIMVVAVSAKTRVRRERVMRTPS